MNLFNIIKVLGNKRKSKRVGRGYGSGKGGHTSGKGAKGQKARSGNKHLVGFEGGQVPLYKRLPQMGGFKNPNSKNVVSVNLKDLNAFRTGAKVTPQDLVGKKIIRELPRKAFVKILGDGTLEKKLTLKGFLYSKTAKEALEKAGCELQA
jgi:large subunit ribosomal protein L15